MLKTREIHGSWVRGSVPWVWLTWPQSKKKIYNIAYYFFCFFTVVGRYSIYTKCIVFMSITSSSLILNLTMRHGVRFYIKGEGWQKLPFSEFLGLLNYRVNCCNWWCVVCKQYYILNLKLSVHRMLVAIKCMHVVCIIINKTEYYEILTIKCTQLSSYHKLTTFGS